MPKTSIKQVKTSMADLLAEADLNALDIGDMTEGTIIDADKHELWLDLGVYGTGLVIGKEIEGSSYNIGDKVSASVLEVEAPEGYATLSLKKVAKEKGWDLLEERFKKQEVFGIVPYDANKGGLLVEVDGIKGFLPVSQLSAENYPRVTGADKDEILHRLNNLINRTLMVRILDLDRRQNKLIISEKAAQKELTKDKLASLKVDEKVKGIVTGVVDFGIFVNVNGIEGLVHISEISWDRVDNPSKFVKVGQEIEAKIIAIDQEKLSLSMKQLGEDPWGKEIANYQVNDVVGGKITRITPFGAFVEITPSIEALVHVSELSDKHIEDPSKLVKIGESKKFKIIAIDPSQHKLSLSLKTKIKSPPSAKAGGAKKVAKNSTKSSSPSAKKAKKALTKDIKKAKETTMIKPKKKKVSKTKKD
ncbi:MAG: S1 RNA-binding domain-containing protein [bacterium]|nr:S1 RNA-binding domain-containing protein [bacterium]